MLDINVSALVGKLNQITRRAMEGAAGLCMSRTNFHIEIEHWLLKLLETPNTDIHKLLRQYDADVGKVNRELVKALEGFKTGNGRAPELADDITDLIRDAWTIASLEHNGSRIRSGHLLIAMLNDRMLANKIKQSVPEFKKLPADKLVKEMPVVCAGTAEDEPDLGMASSGVGAVGAEPGKGPVPGSKTPALDQFTINLTERAKGGHIDPVVGRDWEIRQMIDILTRRRQNNPILAGEAGVGKTAVVEGLALRIVANDVPDILKNVQLRSLDLGLLQAGAGVKGEFENRLKQVIAETKASMPPTILFIDEAHTMIGAGGQQGQGDAANLLKPALARGELRTIAATTWAEYKKYFETDAALKRRFQVVKVEEPTVDLGIKMMRGIVATLEKHHKVRILDEAVEDAVKLSHRYISDRQLPDKSVSLLDTACAKVGLSQTSTPAGLEEAVKELEHLKVEVQTLEREQITGGVHGERLGEVQERTKVLEDRKATLEKQWKEELAVVEQIRDARSKLERSAGDAKDPKPEDKLSPAQTEELRNKLGEWNAQLRKLQGETPLVFPVVDRNAVAEVVSSWTGIPVGKMVVDEIKTVLNLAIHMGERVVGQDHGLQAISQRIQTSRAGLSDPRRPIGVFLLVGPSGVGKTETAISLAEILYGGDKNMVIINMSEYKDASKISNLVGSAKGLVGYGEGGVLTEAVRRKPYCVVLLDEVEKAHQDVQELFYQVFDKGMLQDSNGNDVDFKNTIIILTSNAGSDTIMKLCADPDTRPDDKGLAEAMRDDLLKHFKPALLGRMTVVPYFALSDDMLRKIIHLQLKRIKNRIYENYKAVFEYDDSLVAAVASRCKEAETGARNADHIITGTLLPEISKTFLTRLAEGHPITRATVGVDASNNFTYGVE